MENWLERKSEIIKRQELEKQEQIKRKANAIEVERQKKLREPSREKKEEMRILEVKAKIAALPALECKTFELLDRLGVKDILEEIKRDVWRQGNVEEVWDDRSGQIKKGLVLDYHYKYPSLSLTRVSKRKLGHYYEDHTSQSGMGEFYSDPIVRFGFHDEVIGESLGYSMKETRDGLEVSILRQELSERSSGVSFTSGKLDRQTRLYLNVRGHFSKNGDGYLLNPENLDVGKAKNFLEDRLLAECTEMEAEYRLPLQVESIVKQEVSIIEGARNKIFPIPCDISGIKKKLGLRASW